MNGGVLYSKRLIINDCEFNNNSVTSGGWTNELRGTIVHGGLGGNVEIYKTSFFTNQYVAGNSRSTASLIHFWRSGTIQDTKFIDNKSKTELIYSHTNLELVHSLIYNNDAERAIRIPAGIISKSTIVGNSGIGIYVEQSGMPPEIRYSNIYENPTYALYNNSQKDVDARYNYWGTDDPSIIFDLIYDKWDNANKGEVDFGLYDSTYLTSFSNKAPRIKMISLPWIPLLLF